MSTVVDTINIAKWILNGFFLASIINMSISWFYYSNGTLKNKEVSDRLRIIVGIIIGLLFISTISLYVFYKKIIYYELMFVSIALFLIPILFLKDENTKQYTISWTVILSLIFFVYAYLFFYVKKHTYTYINVYVDTPNVTYVEEIDFKDDVDLSLV